MSPAQEGVHLWEKLGFWSAVVGGVLVIPLSLGAFFRLGYFWYYVLFSLGGTLPWTLLFYFEPFNPLGENPMTDPRLVHELSDEERKVLTFLRTSATLKSRVVINGLMLFVGYLACALPTYWWSPNRTNFFSAPALDQALVVVVAGFGLYGLLFTFGIHARAVYRYVVHHWDDVQATQVPWPKDKPYTRLNFFLVYQRRRLERAQKEPVFGLMLEKRQKLFREGLSLTELLSFGRRKHQPGKESPDTRDTSENSET